MAQLTNVPSLDDLPPEETAEFEYKSSQLATRRDQLKAEISRAASAFWNSGGGTLVLGVDNSGKPDDGLPARFGQKPLHEWLDVAVHSTQPMAEYEIQTVDCPSGSLPGDTSAKKVAILTFARSRQIPHMAQDNRYYIRVGAHTEPASQFLVEALLAQRTVSQPYLVHALRFKPGSESLIQLGVVATNDTPAFDVEIDVLPPPEDWKKDEAVLPIRLPMVDRQNPFYADLGVAFGLDAVIPPDAKIRITYHDRAGEKYEYTHSLNVERAIGPTRYQSKGIQDVASHLEEIVRELRLVVQQLAKRLR